MINALLNLFNFEIRKLPTSVQQKNILNETYFLKMGINNFNLSPSTNKIKNVARCNLLHLARNVKPSKI